MKSAYVVNSDPVTFGKIMSATSRVHGLTVDGCTNYRAAIADIQSTESPFTASIVILDLKIEGRVRGIELAQMVKNRLPGALIIFFTRDIVLARKMTDEAGITMTAFIDSSSKIASQDLSRTVEEAFSSESEAPAISKEGVSHAGGGKKSPIDIEWGNLLKNLWKLEGAEFGYWISGICLRKDSVAKAKTANGDMIITFDDGTTYDFRQATTTVTIGISGIIVLQREEDSPGTGLILKLTGVSPKNLPENATEEEVDNALRRAVLDLFVG